MKIRIEFILDILLVIIMCSYAGPFASYKGINILIFVTLIIYLLTISFKLISIKKRKMGLLYFSLFCFIFFNALLNIPKSFFYLMLFIFCTIILKRNLSITNILLIKKILAIVSEILMLSIIIQIFFPSIFYKLAKIWFFYSNQYEMVYKTDIISHHYSGLMYEVSYSAVILTIGICIFFAEYMTKKKNKILNICLMIITYFTIYMTGKRSFILIIPITLGIYWFLFNIKKITITRLILILMVTISFVYMSEDIFLWIINILKKGHSSIQLSSRERYWEIAIKMFKSSPIIGRGINSFDVYFNQSGIKEQYYNFAGAHNSYLQILAEMGVLGFILYSTYIAKNIYNGLKKLLLFIKINDNKAACNLIFALTGLTCMLIYAFSGNFLYQPQQLVTFFFLIAIIQYYNYKK